MPSTLMCNLLFKDQRIMELGIVCVAVFGDEKMKIKVFLVGYL
jgi:hypothetical protein